MFQSECASRLSSITVSKHLYVLCGVFRVSDRSVRRITRALKNAVLQQQMINVDKAMQILEQETLPLVVDRDKLKVCGTQWVLVCL